MSKAHTVHATSEDPPVNFRTRTGRIRRARTRANILSAAFEVFDSKGVGRTTVEDVRERAGLARGSFYNYFQTRISAYGARTEGFVAELMNAISRQLDKGA